MLIHVGVIIGIQEVSTVMGNFANGFNGGTMVLMGLFGLVFFGIVIALIFSGIKYVVAGSKPALGNKAGDALEQLKMRLARGEITPDEYEMLRAHLKD